MLRAPNLRVQRQLSDARHSPDDHRPVPPHLPLEQYPCAATWSANMSHGHPSVGQGVELG